MRIGIMAGAMYPGVDRQALLELGRGAEARGSASIWAGEHVVLFDDYLATYPYARSGRFPLSGESGLLEPFTTLAFLAAITERVRLGTAVCLVPQRNPLYTAEEVANVDFISGGRFDFGIGIGWQREEFEALGVDWPRRGARNDDYVELMRTIWTDAVSSHDGAFHTLPASRAFPKPIQSPHPPIWVGGESDAALDRVARLGAHWLPFNLAADTLAERRVALAERIEAGGRSMADVGIIALARRPLPELSTEDLAAYAAAGADELLYFLHPSAFGSVAEALDRVVPIIEAAAAL